MFLIVAGVSESNNIMVTLGCRDAVTSQNNKNINAN